ncbi:MAG: hypothetical protein JRN62_03720 [Nitrososphaerota archaeon]|nr:hypothetical protein [Nitrososphaerota archaeon]MDG6948710.1 hypothetical protein [Nitrososphaerota archaeon]
MTGHKEVSGNTAGDVAKSLADLDIAEFHIETPFWVGWAGAKAQLGVPKECMLDDIAYGRYGSRNGLSRTVVDIAIKLQLLREKALKHGYGCSKTSCSCSKETHAASTYLNLDAQLSRVRKEIAKLVLGNEKTTDPKAPDPLALACNVTRIQVNGDRMTIRSPLLEGFDELKEWRVGP